jgi:dimethylaniline monooxygenase (N-oxide forming)
MNTNNSPEIKVDVCVIGSGLSGLLAMKYLQEEGLSYIGLEERDDVGGIFNFSPDPNISTVLMSTETNVSRSVMEFSDHPLSYRGLYGRTHVYMHQSEYINYIYSYCKKYSLIENIRFHTSIIDIQKQNDKWHITFQDKNDKNRASSIVICRNIVVSTGIHSKKNFLTGKERFKNYSGKIFYGHEFKATSLDFYKKNVLIIGTSETAADIANDLSFVCNKVIMFDDMNTHFYAPKHNRYSLDFLSRLHHYAFGDNGYGEREQAMYRYVFKILAYFAGDSDQGVTRELLLHGVPVKNFRLKGNPNKETRLINKSTYFLERIVSGDILLKGNITDVTKRRIAFDSVDDVFDIDYICICHGFRNPYSINKFYRYIFPVEDPSVAFNGFVRPIIGGIPMIAENQARFVAQVFSGKTTLPSKKEMIEKVEYDRSRYKKVHRNAHQRIVIADNINYCDEIALAGGFYPKLSAQLKAWRYTLFSPQHAAFYHLGDAKKRDMAKKILNKYVFFSPAILPIFLVNRILPRIIYFLSPYLYERSPFHDTLSMLKINRADEVFDDLIFKKSFRWLYAGLSASLVIAGFLSGAQSIFYLGIGTFAQHLIYNINAPQSDFKITYQYQPCNVFDELKSLVRDESDITDKPRRATRGKRKKS